MKNYCCGVVGYIEGLGLDPAFITPQDLLEIGIHYYRFPGQRGEGYIPIEEITPYDFDPAWLEMTVHSNDSWMDADDDYIDAGEDDPWESDFSHHHWGEDHELIQEKLEQEATKEAVRLRRFLASGSDSHSRKRVSHPNAENARRHPPLRDALPPPLQTKASTIL